MVSEEEPAAVPPPPRAGTGYGTHVPFVAQYLVDPSVPPPPPIEEDTSDDDDDEDFDEMGLVPPPPPLLPPPPPPEPEPAADAPAGKVPSSAAAPRVVPDAPESLEALYGVWETVAVEEVDEEKEHNARLQLEKEIREHATCKKERGATLSDRFNTDPDADPMDAFSTYNPFGGAYKGVNIDDKPPEPEPVLFGPSQHPVSVPTPVAHVAAIPVSVTEGDDDTAEFKKRKRPAGIMNKKKQKA